MLEAQVLSWHCMVPKALLRVTPNAELSGSPEHCWVWQKNNDNNNKAVREDFLKEVINCM